MKNVNNKKSIKNYLLKIFDKLPDDTQKIVVVSFTMVFCLIGVFVNYIIVMLCDFSIWTGVTNLERAATLFCIELMGCVVLGFILAIVFTVVCFTKEVINDIKKAIHEVKDEINIEHKREREDC